MCASCREAGDTLADRREGLPPLSAPMRVIERMHRDCLYPQSCTCQHAVIGRWLQT